MKYEGIAVPSRSPFRRLALETKSHGSDMRPGVEPEDNAPYGAIRFMFCIVLPPSMLKLARIGIS